MVYEAYDRERDAVVALKVLRVVEADALYRFKKAFRSLADIRHPNLATFYELHEEDGHWYLTLECIDGVDFQVFLHQLGPTERFDRIRDAFTQLARALQTLHADGKLHRDIKPSNVMVTPQGRVVLLDFGLVAELGPGGFQESAATLMAGTPIYMSIEQAEGRPATPASDWYSVGVMLYEAVVGRVPFEGSLVEILSRKRQGLDHRLRDVAPRAPADLAAVCEGLLVPAPDRRMGGDEVLRRLTAGSASPPRVDAATSLPLRPRGTPFVGRGEPLATLRQAYEVSRRRAVAVLVRGGSGVGKTALVQHFLDGLTTAHPETVVLRGRCYRQETVPYKGIDSLIDALSHWLNRLPPEEVEPHLPADVAALARLFPVLGRIPAVAAAPALAETSPQAVRRRAVLALRALFGSLAEVRPLVLFMDDVHWGDLDSAVLLERILRPPSPPKVLVLGTHRDGARADTPTRLAEQRTLVLAHRADLRELVLEPLDFVESHALAAASIGSSADTVLTEAVVRESGGNPLLLAELVRIAGRDDGRAMLDDTGEVQLADLIAVRLARLSRAARRLIEIMAVAGRPLEVDVLRQSAHLGAETEEALEALRESRLVRQEVGAGESIELHHDRVRDVVLEGLDEAALRDHHRALAMALESSGRGEPETLAVHFEMTEDHGRAAGYAASAAARAERALAFERAARLYQTALDLLPAESPDRGGLVVKLAGALANAGRSLAAAETYLQAVRDAGYLDPIGLQRRAAELLLTSGHTTRGLAVLRHVLRTAGLTPDDGGWRARWSRSWRRLRLTRALRSGARAGSQAPDPRDVRTLDICWSAVTGLLVADVDQAASFHERHLTRALAAGDRERLERSLALEVFFGALAGRPGQPRKVLDDTPGEALEALVALADGLAACAFGRWTAVSSHFERAERGWAQAGTGVTWERGVVEHHHAVVAVLGGRWRDWFAVLPDRLEQARERGDVALEAHDQVWGRCWQELAADEAEAALARADAVLASWPADCDALIRLGHALVGVNALLYSGRAGLAWQRLEEGWAALVDSPSQRLPFVRALAWDLRGRAALATLVEGASGGTVRHVRQAERTLRGFGLDWTDGLAATLRGGLASLAGQVDSATEALDAAREAVRAGDMALHEAALAGALAGLRGHDDDRAAAAARLDQLGVAVPERWIALLCPGSAIMTRS